MTTYKIGYPCSPSVFNGAEEFIATEVLVTWGGGMGGASKTYYATEIKKGEYTLIDGNKIMLNPNFIVHEKKVKVLVRVDNITRHANYHKTTCKRRIVTRYFKADMNENFEIVQEYHDTQKNRKTILETVDTEL